MVLLYRRLADPSAKALWLDATDIKTSREVKLMFFSRSQLLATQKRLLTLLRSEHVIEILDVYEVRLLLGCSNVSSDDVTIPSGLSEYSGGRTETVEILGHSSKLI